jgi:hypothetical protein
MSSTKLSPGSVDIFGRECTRRTARRQPLSLYPHQAPLPSRRSQRPSSVDLSQCATRTGGRTFLAGRSGPHSSCTPRRVPPRPEADDPWRTACSRRGPKGGPRSRSRSFRRNPDPRAIHLPKCAPPQRGYVCGPADRAVQGSRESPPTSPAAPLLWRNETTGCSACSR